MTLRLTIFLTLIITSTFAQKTFVGDTTFWSRYKKQQYQQLGLDDMAASKDALTVRFSYSNEIIELSTSDYKVFEGQHVLFTSLDGKENETRNYIHETRLINRDTARQLYNLIMEYKILTAPSQEKIKGWNQGIDGTTYVFETATPRQYSIKKYWSPSSIRNVPEAASISEFLSKVRVLLDQKKRVDNFFTNLPPGCYSYGSMSSKCISRAQKTNLHKMVKAMMNTITNNAESKENAGSTVSTEGPIVLLNNKIVYDLDVLKKYTLSQIESISLTLDDSPITAALFGSRKSNEGVIIIQTK